MLIVAFLAGCGDDSAQRKAFIDYLQTQIIAKPGIQVPQPTPEEAKSFGELAKHYEIIIRFNAGLDAQVTGPIVQAVQSGSFRSLQDLMSHRDDLAGARDSMQKLTKALDEQRATADAAHAALKQPDDVKPIFDAAFAKDVTEPARALAEIVPEVSAGLDAALALADYLNGHRDGIKVQGRLVQATDSALQKPLASLLEALHTRSDGIRTAQKRLIAITTGG